MHGRDPGAGHLAYFITDDDPSFGFIPGHRNTAGDGFSLFNEVLVCTTAVDTLRPNGTGSYRAWNTPVHEFGHAIEETLGLHARTADVNSTNRDDYDWEADYLARIFDVENEWVPTCSR